MAPKGFLCGGGGQHGDAGRSSGICFGDDFSIMETFLLDPLLVNMSFPMCFLWIFQQQRKEQSKNLWTR